MRRTEQMGYMSPNQVMLSGQAQKNPAMMPGLKEMPTGDSFMRVNAENQPGQQMRLARQQQQRNTESMPANAVNQMRGDMTNAVLAQETKDKKVQDGLTRVLADVVDTQVATGGVHLEALAKAQEDPRFAQRIGAGSRLGTNLLA